MYKEGKYILYKEHMNLRENATVNSNLITVIPQGTSIDVTEVYDNWGKTEYNGVTGWCCISECFARLICCCGAETCCYYEKYIKLSEEYEKLLKKVDDIKALIR